MTDRDDNGQLAAAEPEPLTGRDGNEAEAGYRSMDQFEGKSDGLEFDGVQDAADFLTIHRDESPDAIVRPYLNTRTGEFLDPAITITPERGADDLAKIRNDELSSTVAADSFRDEIDAMRAEEAIKDPEAAEKVKTEAKERPSEVKPAKEAAEPADPDGLDHEVARALKLPQVAQAIEHEWSKADGVRAQYSAAVDQANRISQLALVDALPELANVPIDRWQAAIEVLHAQDPQRVQRATGLIERAGQLYTAQQQQAQQRAVAEQQAIETWAKSEDARLKSMGIEFNKQNVDEIKSYSKSLGVEPETLRDAMMAHPILRSVGVQRMMMDAAKYHAMKSAPARAAPKDVPRVQRPGVSQPRVAVGTTARADFDKNPSIETAWRALAARRKG